MFPVGPFPLPTAAMAKRFAIQTMVLREGGKERESDDGADQLMSFKICISFRTYGYAFWQADALPPPPIRTMVPGVAYWQGLPMGTHAGKRMRCRPPPFALWCRGLPIGRGMHEVHAMVCYSAKAPSPPNDG